MRLRLIIPVLALLMPGCAPAQAAPQRPALPRFRSWAILLNPGAAEQDPRVFRPYDLVVLDPDAHPPLAQVRQEPRTLLGYVSLGEAERYRPYWARVCGAPWILRENPDWAGNFRVDVRSLEWHRLLLEVEIPRILSQGFDGLFLDTLDLGDALEVEGLAGSRSGMLELVREIRGRFPCAVLISNNGLGLLPQLGDLVDGFATEGLSCQADLEKGTSSPLPESERAEKVRLLKSVPGKPVFVIEYAREAAQAREAVLACLREGFLPYVAPVGLNALMTLAVPPSAAPAELPRTVLAIYDSSEYRPGPVDHSDNYQEGIPEAPPTVIHENAEMVLNHLGFKVRYHDIARGLPAPAALEGTAGILTWFLDEKMPRAAEYCRWLKEAARAGHRVAVLECFGAFQDSDTGKEVPESLPRNALRELGLEWGSRWTDSPLRMRIAEKVPERVEFERDLSGELSNFAEVRAIDPASRVWLKLERTDLPKVVADAVVITPRGGYAQVGYVLHRDPATGRRQWRIDPFRFFEDAFDAGGRPRPDVTTQNGRRIWFSHIDGDGFSNGSAEKGRVCAEVIRDRVLRAYDLPFTASVITGEIDPAAMGSPEAVAMARSIFALPNVEPAGHGYGHPHDWSKGTIMLKGIPQYTVASEKAEILGAAEFINRELLPEGKKVELFLWTGACNPTESAIRMATDAGLLNMNGGNTRMDPLYPSYGYVVPLTRDRGNALQVLAPATNDNILTNGLSSPLFGFRNVLHSFRNTEVPEVVWTRHAPPRRVAPIDVYFHFFSASGPAALKALLEVMDATSRQEIAPIHAGGYVRKVQGFLSARIEKLGEGHWRVSDYGECRTIRFDQPRGLPDLSRSPGCMGFRKEGDRLYVHLDSGDSAEIALSEIPPVPSAYLEQSSHAVEGWSRDGRAVRFRTRGWGKGTTVLAEVPPGPWTLRSIPDGRAETVFPDPSGRLVLVLPQGSYALEPPSP